MDRSLHSPSVSLIRNRSENLGPSDTHSRVFLRNSIMSDGVVCVLSLETSCLSIRLDICPLVAEVLATDALKVAQQNGGRSHIISFLVFSCFNCVQHLRPYQLFSPQLSDHLRLLLGIQFESHTSYSTMKSLGHRCTVRQTDVHPGYSFVEGVTQKVLHSCNVGHICCLPFLESLVFHFFTTNDPLDDQTTLERSYGHAIGKVINHQDFPCLRNHQLAGSFAIFN
jgi:hypothetical protein